MSKDISQKFLIDPQSIISKIPITSKLLSMPAANFRIIASDDEKSACIMPEASGFAATFLPYNAAGPQVVNVNRAAPANNFLVTATLSGCSIYVTDVGNGTINVWHDPRTAPAFTTGGVYDQDGLPIIADFAYARYSDSMLASAIMIHNGTFWTIFGQKLFIDDNNQRTDLLPQPYNSILWEDFYPRSSVVGIIVP